MAGLFQAMGPNPSGTQFNWCQVRQDNSQLAAGLQAGSGATPGTQWMAAMRFLPPVTLTKDNLRVAQLQICGADNVDTRNDCAFTVAGEKVANAPVFTVAAHPGLRWVNATTARFDYVFDNQPALPQVIQLSAGSTYSFTDILREIMNVPGWVPGNPLVIFLRGFTQAATALQRFQPPSSNPATDLYGPRLSVVYGDASTDAIDFDLGFIGNSHPAYAGHAGFTVSGITVPIFGGTSLTGPAGMKNVDTGWYGGDNFRGWVPNGFVQTAMETKWGDKIAPFRAEHAVAGSTCAQWAADAGVATTGKWGDPANRGSARYRLAHPQSPSRRQVWVGEFLGNDVNAFAAQTLIYGPEVPALCDDLWDAWVDETEPRLRIVLDEFWEWADPPELAYLYIIGLPNFPLRKSLPSSFVQYYCVSAAGDLFRSGAGIQGQGHCYKQIDYDSGVVNADTGHYGRPELSYQSARVQAAARWQQVNHPEEIPPGAPPELAYNPNGTFWPTAVFPSSINLAATGAFANANWIYPTGVDRWAQSMRNVHDINFNRRHHQMQELYRRVKPDYPNLIFVPTNTMMGVDEVYSHDPTSPFAQSEESLWVEGIHPNLAGLNAQFVAPGTQLDKMTRYVPFLQRLGTFFTRWTGVAEEPVQLQGIWDGAAVQPCYVDEVAA